MENYPRLLVLSNNSFSKSNSNGRTLGSLLQGWPKDRIAQFCISSDGADFDVCDNYFCVTDADVLHATLHMKAARRRDLKDAHYIDSNRADGHVKHRKTSFKMLVRNTLWNLGVWRGKEFNKWVSDFAPDIILLQSGDSYFMHQLAMHLAKRTSATLATFNTEGSFFFYIDFFLKDGIIGRNVLFKIYQSIYRSVFSKFMSHCEKQIYCNELLRQDYDAKFGSKNSIVLYTSSKLQFSPSKLKNKVHIFSYLGNMGFNRPDALIEFAKTINEINPLYKLDVYGSTLDTESEDRLRDCEAINFHGQIPYSEVINVISNSDFLIHVESQDKKYSEALRYGFSTKIADSISSGKIIILYSSPEIACAQYIQTTGAGIFASNASELKQKLIEVINSVERRMDIEKAARRTAKLNHNIATNSAVMVQYLSK